MDVKAFGGGAILARYKDSMLAALQQIYPEFQWNPLLRKHGVMNAKNTREMLDWLSDTWNIETQDDWYSLMQNKMRDVGGSAWALKTLKSAYPEFSWKIMKKPSAPALLLAHTWHEGIDPTGV